MGCQRRRVYFYTGACGQTAKRTEERQALENGIPREQCAEPMPATLLPALRVRSWATDKTRQTAEIARE